MKVILGLLVIVGIVLTVVYFQGGVATHDPEKQGQDARKQIKPGMTWQQVFKITGDPKRYQTFIKQGNRPPAPGAAVPFDRKTLESEIKNGTHQYGWQVVYQYTAKSAFTVMFDTKGVVDVVQDAMTVADLLDQR